MSFCERANKISTLRGCSPAPDGEKRQIAGVGSYESILGNLIKQFFNSTYGESNSSSFLHSLSNNHRTLLPCRVSLKTCCFPPFINRQNQTGLALDLLIKTPFRSHM